MMDNFLVDFDIMINRNQNRYHSEEFYNKLSETKRDIEINFKRINKVFSMYDSLNFKEVQTIFEDLMECLKNDLIITGINGIEPFIPKLYRIREVNAVEKLTKPSELFHIPFTKRNLISNERYSLSGHPCLYLATYLGIAWQECGLSKKFYYSEFQYMYSAEQNENWRFITFVSPRKFANNYLVAMGI